jgi:hypothetical protein
VQQQDVPFFSHAPYSPFQQDYMDIGAGGELWSVLPHSNEHGNVCDVKHQDGGFYCTDMERINMMGDNGGKCLYCRQPLMPCHFKKVEGGWPTLQTFLDSCIPVGPKPQPQVSSASMAQGGVVQPQPQVSSAFMARGSVPEMPKRMSNNRNKTWSKYVKLYNKTGDQAHLNVLQEMVREENNKSATSAP